MGAAERAEAMRRLKEPRREVSSRAAASRVLNNHPRRRPSIWLLAAAAWLDRPGYTVFVHALDWSAGRLVERGL